MKLTPHLTFDGQCEAAFTFYERVFGGKIVTMRAYANSPMADKVSPDWLDKIVHANLIVGENSVAGADVPAPDYQEPQGFYVLLDDVHDPAEATRIFHALAENGTVEMPIQKTFWSPAYGVVVDQFGIPWEISCEHAPDSSSPTATPKT
jgi:PhnB protein